ncbi:hypothetical protein CEXT_329301 [Caerostris extrusa]|uniref:Uncharacterized protein n=1 Tax=Caerostris extrusa TaxID=172846 RepID=A0AAV4Y8K6_CAEEX|nr:hypothetical protein CEXT_329301 [Caerostris extrusa]
MSPDTEQDGWPPLDPVMKVVGRSRFRRGGACGDYGQDFVTRERKLGSVRGKVVGLYSAESFKSRYRDSIINYIFQLCPGVDRVYDSSCPKLP